MTARWGIVVGVLAIAAGIAWFAVRRGGSADDPSIKSDPDHAAGLTARTPGGNPQGSGARRDGKIDLSPKSRPREQCLLAMSGTEAEMTKALADLETEGGLRGFADHIILDGPVVADGKMTVRAYAVFDRRARETN